MHVELIHSQEIHEVSFGDFSSSFEKKNNVASGFFDLVNVLSSRGSIKNHALAILQKSLIRYLRHADRTISPNAQKRW